MIGPGLRFRRVDPLIGVESRISLLKKDLLDTNIIYLMVKRGASDVS